MPDSNEVVGFIGAAIDLLAIVPYVLDILRGRIKPHIFSWLIWTTVMAVGFSAQIAGGAGPGSWVTGMGVVTTFSVLCLSLAYGSRDITGLDWFFFITASAAIPLWALTKNPLPAVFLVTGIDLLAYGPTFRKSWFYPHQEQLTMWLLGAVKFTLAITALRNYSLLTWLYPATIVGANLSLVIMLVLRRRTVEKAKFPYP